MIGGRRGRTQPTRRMVRSRRDNRVRLISVYLATKDLTIFMGLFSLLINAKSTHLARFGTVTVMPNIAVETAMILDLPPVPSESGEGETFHLCVVQCQPKETVDEVAAP
ncbi:hypothetical protein F5Y01DRAFT_316616 [Xylaria sp. FL0043]|nr:hypothetical protein F5Y01DRAFT_316616 [Xylaria sp. FL0043]